MRETEREVETEIPKKSSMDKSTYNPTLYIYIYIYVCVCVCVLCAFVRVCVCVCV